MEPSKKRIQELLNEVSSLWQNLQIESKSAELKTLDEQLSSPDIWQDNTKAQGLAKRQSKLQQSVTPWLQLRSRLNELAELANMDDDSLRAELGQQTDEQAEALQALKLLLRFNGPYDEEDALLSIHAGAGGTDAQDWASMLLRMYLRYAEQNDYKTQVIDESTGEEAGIKSATIEVSGPFAFGKLHGEHGVHRLVRLSPFNSDNLRQTSFAKVEVLPKIDKPEAVSIDEKDLKIDVYRSGGKGGQSVNTTDSAVRITHLPTNIVVAIQNERSQLQNKETAMTILRSKLAQLQLEQHQADVRQLKGPNEQAAWGNQIRSYVLHPYKQVKDLRTRHESTEPDAVLDGKLGDFIDSYLEHTITD